MINLRLISHTLALVVLISLANLGLLLALLVKPFKEAWSWSIACGTAEWFWSYMQHHWETSLNAAAALQITGDAIPAHEPALVISNHLSYGDYYLVQALAIRAGMLGKCRYFAKKQLVWQVPVFGWSFWAVGMILVSRAWTSDARLIKEAFARVNKNKHDVWIVLYPEGTRRTPKKLLEAQAFERRAGKKELDRVLFPRPKGFQATVKGIRHSHIKYIYDLTFQYTSPGRDHERVPSLAEQLSCADLAAAGYGFRVHVERISIADLPQDDEALRHWLEERWERKNELLADMLRDEVGTADVAGQDGADTVGNNVGMAIDHGEVRSAGDQVKSRARPRKLA
ncbi:hypothetical protein DB88DRAFT_496182 [Papiliotrema laurentii]|uniref:Phospholipid/glycerol acyltransferase domain-containing protein n=1 Tax=Papiliotrema laurentii TaxID=5418 RepID=A0AAD9CVE1_PAPLA|nr:hypothetical protein DB88DRAFT_496182 [Papiliotrema laurentii]